MGKEIISESKAQKMLNELVKGMSLRVKVDDNGKETVVMVTATLSCGTELNESAVNLSKDADIYNGYVHCFTQIKHFLVSFIKEMFEVVPDGMAPLATIQLFSGIRPSTPDDKEWPGTPDEEEQDETPPQPVVTKGFAEMCCNCLYSHFVEGLDEYVCRCNAPISSEMIEVRGKDWCGDYVSKVPTDG